MYRKRLFSGVPTGRLSFALMSAESVPDTEIPLVSWENFEEIKRNGFGATNCLYGFSFGAACNYQAKNTGTLMQRWSGLITGLFLVFFSVAALGQQRGRADSQ